METPTQSVISKMNAVLGEGTVQTYEDELEQGLEILQYIDKYFTALKLKYKNNSTIKHYALTLTTKSRTKQQLIDVIEKLYKRKCIPLIEYSVEYTKNDIPHIHAYLKSTTYLKNVHMYNLNNKESVKLDLLRTKADVDRWLDYISKESDTFRLGPP